MLKRTRRSVDLWIIRAIARAKHAALTGKTLGAVIRAALPRRSPPQTLLAEQLTDFIESLRHAQVGALIELLDVGQKIMFVEIASTAAKIVDLHDAQLQPQRLGQPKTGPREAVK